MKKTTMLIRINKKTHTELKTHCAKNGLTMSNVIRGLINDYLDENIDRTADRKDPPNLELTFE